MDACNAEKRSEFHFTALTYAVDLRMPGSSWEDDRQDKPEAETNRKVSNSTPIEFMELWDRRHHTLQEKSATSPTSYRLASSRELVWLNDTCSNNVFVNWILLLAS
jgi:hypothetical protein